MFRRNLKKLMASRRLLSLPEEVERLEKIIGELKNDLTTREEFDRFKSSLQVPRQQLEEFAAWKKANPIPAEPFVSITVVTYNRARLLVERCLASLLSQTYKNFELIIVGDRCTDDTEKRVNQIGDPRITFFNLWERPEYPADPLLRWMSAGAPPSIKSLQMARGDLITHLDDDDEHVPDRLEKLVSFAIKNQCDMVWHPFWTQLEDGNWRLAEAKTFSYTNVTHSSVLYSGWFKNVLPVLEPHLLMEPGDWHRFRRIKYFNPIAMRYPEPLLKHYRERQQSSESSKPAKQAEA